MSFGSGGLGIGAAELAVLLIFVLIYFLPTIKAMQVAHRHSVAIVLLNIFAGWLIIPWIIAMVWAFKKPAA